MFHNAEKVSQQGQRIVTHDLMVCSPRSQQGCQPASPIAQQEVDIEVICLVFQLKLIILICILHNPDNKITSSPTTTSSFLQPHSSHFCCEIRIFPD